MLGVKVDNIALAVPGRTLWSDLSFELKPGDSFAIMGPSGSGKTSLLHCLCGIKRPATGGIVINGIDVTTLGASALAALRRDLVGIVFQFGELLPELSVAENVQLPLRLAGCNRKDAAARAIVSLQQVGLGDAANARPDVLSGGEVQRVAIARATAKAPALVLADEPTGALDEANGLAVARLLFALAKDLGAVVVVATHNPNVARLADRIAFIRNGHLQSASGAEAESRAC